MNIEHPLFDDSWFDLCFFVENNGKPLCLTCKKKQY